MSKTNRQVAKSVRSKAKPVLSVRLNEQVSLQAYPDGSLAAMIGGYAIDLGRFSPQTRDQAAELHGGVALSSFAGDEPRAQEMAALVRRLARRGLVEYRLSAGRHDLVAIEPQLAEYWPMPVKLRGTDRVVLSRFAYLRRRADALVLESPRAGALFRICDPAFASLIASLAVPQRVASLEMLPRFPGRDLLGLLAGCDMLFVPGAKQAGLRDGEGDPGLVMWDFHDLLFHTRSTEGRQANPLGGIYPYADKLPPLPAERPPWPGKRLELAALAANDRLDLPIANLLEERHSVRDFNDGHPITLAELALLLDLAARVRSRWETPVELAEGDGPVVSYTSRPYPAAGSAYELELYLAVANCAGLPRGFYHYDASSHALVAIEVADAELAAMLASAQFAMGASDSPQVLITMAARFGRLSWKYATIAYSLILKDVGVLMQTLYLAATATGLGGCAIGTSNIELFSKMTKLPFHVEGPVGVFALGREAAAQTA